MKKLNSKRIVGIALGLALCIVATLGSSIGWPVSSGNILYLIILLAGLFCLFAIGKIWIELTFVLLLPLIFVVGVVQIIVESKIKRKAKQFDYALTTVDEIYYYGETLGHCFQYHYDQDGIPVVTDRGKRPGFQEGETEFAFNGNHQIAVPRDYARRKDAWSNTTKKSWISEDQQNTGNSK